MYLNQDVANLNKDVQIGALTGAAMAMSVIFVYKQMSPAGAAATTALTQEMLELSVKHFGKGVLIGAFLGAAAGDESVDDSLPISETHNSSIDLAGDTNDMLEEV